MASLNEHAVGLAEILHKQGSSHFREVVDNWGGRVLGDLSTPCRSWLAAWFAQLDQEERQTVIQGLAPVQQSDQVDEDVGERYREFSRALSSGARNTAEIWEHLTGVVRYAVQATVVQAGNQGTTGAVNVARDYLSEVMPVLAFSLDLLSEEDSAALLNRVFSEALYIGQAPALLAEFHGMMVGEWPSLEDVGYDVTSIFDRAESTLNGHPQIEKAPELLRSMASLAGHVPLESEYTERILDSACTLWPQHTEEAAEVITSYETTPPLERLAGLAQGVDPASTTEISRLREVWEHCAAWMEVEEHVEVIVALLNLSPMEVEGHPDWALESWLRVLPDPAAALHTALTDERLADEDLERLWRRTVERAAQLGPEFFRSVLPELVARGDIERTNSALQASVQQITDLHEGQAARNELGRSLLEALVKSDSQHVKGFLAQWIDDASAVGSFGHLNELQPSDTDIEILTRKFPDSSRLQEYRKRRGRTDP